MNVTGYREARLQAQRYALDALRIVGRLVDAMEPRDSRRGELERARAQASLRQATAELELLQERCGEDPGMA